MFVRVRVRINVLHIFFFQMYIQDESLLLFYGRLLLLLLRCSALFHFKTLHLDICSLAHLFYFTLFISLECAKHQQRERQRERVEYRGIRVYLCVSV